MIKSRTHEETKGSIREVIELSDDQLDAVSGGGGDGGTDGGVKGDGGERCVTIPIINFPPIIHPKEDSTAGVVICAPPKK